MLREMVEEEIREYKKKKKEFYDNPLHWNNNMRRRHGLPVLRGKVNKYRLKRCSGFHPTAELFYLFDDVVSKEVERNLENYFNFFAEIKEI
mgnify:CR=1 FL=1|jgi:hypothetical protein